MVAAVEMHQHSVGIALITAVRPLFLVALVGLMGSIHWDKIWILMAHNMLCYVYVAGDLLMSAVFVVPMMYLIHAVCLR